MAPASKSSFEKVLHKDTAGRDAGLTAMMRKDRDAQRVAADDYFRHWDKEAKDETEAIRAARSADYASLTRQYYNLATDLYEYGWSQSFHFCRFAPGEPFRQALARHEHYLAHSIGIRRGMHVLDVGCGVGGPAREIAKFTGCRITGLNLNEYQVERARRYAEQERMAEQLQFVQGDFMHIPFPDDTFDAVYAIEATVHAPSLQAVYAEIHRVLKPGGIFGVYEWVMTGAYDSADLAHRKIRLDIEQGDGIANMVCAADALAAVKAAGFELLEHEDLAERPDERPWYWPLDGGSWRHVQSLGDLLGTVRMTKAGRLFTHGLVTVLEAVGLAPPGSVRTSESLCVAAEALVLGGKKGLFTPMFLIVGQKEEVAG